MAKSQNSNSNKDGPSFTPPRHRPRWLTASLCAILAIFMTVAFFDYDPAQYPGNHSGGATVVEHGAVAVKSMQPISRNLVGYFGVYSTYWSYALFGGGAWLLPVFFSWLSYLALRAARRFAITRLMVMLLCVTTLAGLFAWQSTFLMNQRWFPHGPGGVIGALVYVDFLKGIFGVFGAALLMWSAYVLGLLFVFTRDVGAELDRLTQWMRNWKERREARLVERESERRLLREAEAKKRMAAQAAGPVSPARKEPLPAPMQVPNKLSIPKVSVADAPVEKSAAPAAAAKTEAPAKAAPTEPAAASSPSPKAAPERKPAEPKPQPAAEPKAAAKSVVSAPATDTKALEAEAAGKIALHIVKPEELKKAKAAVPATADDKYQFPPLSLLKEQVAPSPENSEEEHQRNAENLLRILGEFGVEVSLGEIHVGPVITRYEVAPAPGVRVEKIAGLDKNIALGMRAQSVRILAPIPGKAAVGVEVPNQHPTPVGMREILESEDWVNAKAEIPIALGKDVSGKPLISDLAKMPHLLIAGATGSGKSVCINSIIASILYSKSPRDLRLLMVDPKVVELKIFNPLPHMLIPVVTEPKKVPGALKWLLNEMEQRYQIFAKCNVRNIAGFNARKRGPDGEPAPVEEQQPTLEGLDDGIEVPDRLPYIVAIIDELADLMMVAPAEIETSIARLAQLARAAGIHLIIATQRPSVNVITGVIKANLPSRIAFQVASQVDSRTILDTKGADMLIGRGDMLFSPPGSSRLVRAQGAFVSDDEVSAMVDYLKRNGPPVYKQDVQAQIDRAARDDDDDEGDGDDDDLGDDDQLYRQALDVLKSTRRASTSMLQRRLRIGYNRAARIMEIMEDKGIVGPENGSSPREILVDLDTL